MDQARQDTRDTRSDRALVEAATRQHRNNMLWEYTQAFLAVGLVSATVVCAVVFREVPETLRNATFVVIGFYFGRTNHTRPVPRDEP